MKLRFRCEDGHVFDGNETTQTCLNCGKPLNLSNCGAIQMYRKGNFMGMAVGMGIYVDNLPYGHIANTESVRIVLPYGQHKLHVTHTSTRACNDPVVEISPAAPIAFVKAGFGAMGFKINVQQVAESEMPPM